MPHDHEGVKAEGSIDADLGMYSTEEGGQPAALSRVHEEKHDIVIQDQLLKGSHITANLFYGLSFEDKKQDVLDQCLNSYFALVYLTYVMLRYIS